MAGQRRNKKTQPFAAAIRIATADATLVAPSAFSGRAALAALVLVGATVLAYLNSFSGAFVFDDNGHIVNNYTIRHLWPPGWLYPTPRPFVDLTLAINYAIGQLKPLGYHVVNLATHILAGLTLFGIVRRTLLVHRAVLNGAGESTGTVLAAVIAALWLLHPLQTQSVTYVIQRSESMMGLFFLLTVYCYILGVHSPDSKLGWYALSIIACTLGMASKAVLVVAPAILFLYDYAFVSRSVGAVVRARWPFLLVLTLTIMVMLVATGLTKSVLSSDPGFFVTVGFGVKTLTWQEYLRSQPGVILHYLRLCFWPHPQCIDYEWPIAAAKDVVAPCLLLAPLVFVSLFALWRWPAWGFLGAWFFGILAPSSSFVPVQDLAMEHRMYLSLAAVIALAVILAYRTAQRTSTGRLVPFAAGAAVLAAALLGWRTFERNKVYANSVALWGDVVKQFPSNCRAWNNYGESLSSANRLPEAAAAYRESIRLNTWLPDAHYNLGKTYYQLGDFPSAEREYLQSIKLAPDSLPAYIMLGNLYSDQKKVAESENLFRRAIQAAGPGCERELLAKAHYNLGNILARRNLMREAVESYTKSTQVDPEYASGYFGLGWACEQLRDFPKAMEYYRKALEVDPSHAQALRGLDELSKRLGAANPTSRRG